MERLTLYQDTFLWVNANQGLLYNTLNGKSYEFSLTPTLNKVCQRLLNYKNLYSVVVDINDVATSRFVAAVERNSFGFVANDEDECNKVSLPPLLCLPQDKRVRSGKFNYEDLMSSVYSICFYMGGKGWDGDYYLQTIYPSSFDNFLTVDDIKFFMRENKFPNNITIKLVFSDITNYPDIDSLLQFLQERKDSNTITVYVRQDEIEHPSFIKIKEACFNIIVLYNDITENTMNSVCHLLRQHKIISYITNSKSVTLNNIDYIPLFIGSNLDFFQKHVFLSKEEIKQRGLSKRIIFAHQVLNTHYFGKLIILPNRNVYSNPSKTALGTIETPMTKLIATEFSKNYAWRVVRNTKKCKKCLYRGLCPSPTFYENIMQVDCIISNEKYQ